MAENQKNKLKEKKPKKGIQRISIKGFKSIADEISLDIEYLTIFAGANSSGKSSFFQPLLLMKQTLEENIDPGVFLLEGGHISFTNVGHIFSKKIGNRRTHEFSIRVDYADNNYFYLVYRNPKERDIEISKAIYQTEKDRIELESDMSSDEIIERNPSIKEFFSIMFDRLIKDKENAMIKTVSNRCFLEPRIQLEDGASLNFLPMLMDIPQYEILRIIHIPPIRGYSTMLYKFSPIGGKFPGTFEYYVPSIINHWKNADDPKFLELKNSLNEMELSWSISTHEIDDTTVELRFPLSPKQIPNKRIDWIRISDLGFGVSQILPVLVALIMAKPEQIVYVEQPEIHLHPQAQLNLANILVKAVNRGVRVVLETHSDLLILGIQTLVAEGNLSPEKTKLHWFTRKKDGSTEVNSSYIKEDGVFDNWPHDFGKINLIAKARFLDASESVKQKIQNK